MPFTASESPDAATPVSSPLSAASRVRSGDFLVVAVMAVALIEGLLSGGMVIPTTRLTFPPVTSKPFNITTAPCEGLCRPNTFCSRFLHNLNFAIFMCVANCSAIDCPRRFDQCLGTPCNRIYGSRQCSRHRTQSIPVCYSHVEAQNFKPCGPNQTWCSRETPYCYPNIRKCDGVKNCPGGEDEMICQSVATSDRPVKTTVPPAPCDNYCDEPSQICRESSRGFWFCDANCTDNGPCSDHQNCTSIKKNPTCAIGDGCDRIPECVPKHDPGTTSAKLFSATSPATRMRTATRTAQYTTSVAMTTTNMTSTTHSGATPSEQVFPTPTATRIANRTTVYTTSITMATTKMRPTRHSGAATSAKFFSDAFLNSHQNSKQNSGIYYIHCHDDYKRDTNNTSRFVSWPMQPFPELHLLSSWLLLFWIL